MLAAQAQQRRRAEELGVAEPGLQLLEGTRCIRELRARDDDAHQVAERRVAEVAPPFELAREKARNVVPRGVGDRAGVRLERLNDDAARRVAAAAPGELGQQLKRPLLGAKV